MRICTFIHIQTEFDPNHDSALKKPRAHLLVVRRSCDAILCHGGEKVKGLHEPGLLMGLVDDDAMPARENGARCE